MTSSSDELDRLLALSLDEVIQLHGPHKAMEIVSEALNLLSLMRPYQALDLSRRAHFLYMHHGTETVRIGFLLGELTLIIKALPIVLPPDLLHKETRSALKKVRIRSKWGRWNSFTTSVALIALARYSAEHNEEAIGLMLLEEGIQLEPYFWHEHAEVLALLRAELLQGLGVNYAHAGREVEAATQYALALGQFLNLGLDSHSLTCLRYINDMLDHWEPEVGLCVAVRLAPVVLQLERQLGIIAVRNIQDIYKRAYAMALQYLR